MNSIKITGTKVHRMVHLKREITLAGKVVFPAETFKSVVKSEIHKSTNPLKSAIWQEIWLRLRFRLSITIRLSKIRKTNNVAQINERSALCISWTAPWVHTKTFTTH